MTDHDDELESRFRAFTHHEAFDPPPVEVIVKRVGGRMNNQRLSFAAVGAAAVLLVGLGFILGRPAATSTATGAGTNAQETYVTRANGDDGTIFDCTRLTFPLLVSSAPIVVIGEVGSIVTTETKPVSEFTGTRTEISTRAFTPFAYVRGDATPGVDRIDRLDEVAANAKGERKIRECGFNQPAVVAGEVLLASGSPGEHLRGHALFRVEFPDGRTPTRDQLDDPRLVAVPADTDTACDHPVNLAALVQVIQSIPPSDLDTPGTARRGKNVYCPPP